MTMERISSPYRDASRKPGILSKFLVTLCSLATIALIIFAGSRDWNSGKSVSEILSDTSDIRGVAVRLTQAKAPQAKEEQSVAQPEAQPSLISNGTLLQRENGAKSLPAGMVTATAY